MEKASRQLRRELLELRSHLFALDNVSLTIIYLVAAIMRFWWGKLIFWVAVGASVLIEFGLLAHAISNGDVNLIVFSIIVLGVLFVLVIQAFRYLK